ncbi:MAG: hypothetical protein PHS41_02190 [Victivallaceae bacterium]|nr:hypothetical protein [Victivallaceae bacterium]
MNYPDAKNGRHKEFLLAWDAILGHAGIENDPDLAREYNRRANAAADEIAAWNSPVPKLWKFYSSGIIVKAGGTVRAFDLNCGCELETARTRLRLAPGTIARLADLIDEAYYTHAHVDHLGIELADALLMRQKTIVTCRDAIDKWLLNPALDAETYHAPGYFCFPSFQRAGNGQLPNCAYVLELMPGCNLLVKGDIYCGSDVAALCDWIDEKKLRIHYAAVSPFALSQPDIVSECTRRYDTIFIPLHEWEFGHRERGTAGTSTQSFADWYRIFDSALARNRARFLFWGESTDLLPVEQISTEKGLPSAK